MSKLWSIFIISMLFATLSEYSSRSIVDMRGEKKYIYKERFFFIVMIVIMAVFVGLRTWYNDTTTYIVGYEMLDGSESIIKNIDWSLGKNPGFTLVNTVMRHSGISTQNFLMIYAITTVSIYLWFLRKYTDNILLAVFFFFTMGNYVFTMAAIKQCVAVAFCLIATDRVVQKKWFSFIVWVGVASTFHPYALMYLVVPFLTFAPWTFNTYFMVVGFGIAGVSLEFMLGTIVNITSMLGEEYDVVSFSGDGVNIFRLAVIWAPVLLSVLARDELRQSNDRATNLIMNLSMLNAEIMFIALFGTANYFARLANYFLIFQAIFLPMLFKYFTKDSQKILYITTITSYLLYFYYANAISQPFDSQFQQMRLLEYVKTLF